MNKIFVFQNITSEAINRVIKKIAGVLLGALILGETIYLVYPYIEHRQMDNFNCAANLVQHYGDESYNLSLHYMIRGNFGLVHITGRSDKNPTRIFNRKVSFKLQQNNDLFHMLSIKNIRLPDDNFSDEDMSLYVPRFFVTPEKDIYMRVLKQKNKSFIFMVDSIPTYLCNATTT
jgi:hypothetical protein